MNDRRLPPAEAVTAVATTRATGAVDDAVQVLVQPLLDLVGLSLGQSAGLDGRSELFLRLRGEGRLEAVD